MRNLVLLNESGDSVLSWTPDMDEEVKEIIQKKMNEGVTFFIVESKFFGLLKTKKKINNVRELEGRSVSIRDEDFATVVLDGKVNVNKRQESGEMKVLTIAQTASEVIQNDCVAVKPMRGG